MPTPRTLCKLLPAKGLRKKRPSRRAGWAVLGLLGILALDVQVAPGQNAAAQPPIAPADPAAAAADAPSIPGFKQVEAAVRGHFAAIKGYRPGDIISRKDVTSLFPKLAKMGWTVREQKDVSALVLDDGDPLVKALHTPAGLKFMRKLSPLPAVYDRMDRLRSMPYGMRRIHELIQGPDGHKLFEYMVTTPGGRNLGVQLSQGKNGAGFNEPTGRLYTEADLLGRLRLSYDKQFKQTFPPTQTTQRRPAK